MQNLTLSYHAFSPFLNRDCFGDQQPDHFEGNLYPYSYGLFYQFLLAQGLFPRAVQLKQKSDQTISSEIDVKSQNQSQWEKNKENQINSVIPQQFSIMEQNYSLEASIKIQKPEKKIKKSKKRAHQTSDTEEEFSPNFTKKNCQTKNITKNFGKAIIGFIFRQIHLVETVLEPMGIQTHSFLQKINELKNKVVSIHGLRELWMEQTNEYAKPFRILSSIFLRKHSLNHIFYSRVTNHSRNIKYRKKILEGLNKPEQFTLIKEY